MEDTQTFIHIIRRNHIKELISNIEQEIGKDKVSPWIKQKIITLRNKAEILVTHRQKRGLINLVGKTSKWLFGTMDDEDRNEIDKHIQELESNNQNLIKGLNEQIKINDFFNETLQLFLQTNDRNQNEILRNFDHLSGEVKHLIESQKILDISLKLQILDDKINQILDSVASIKAGILHPGILTSNEITEFNITLDKLQNARSGILEMNKEMLLIGIKIPINYKKIPYRLLTPLPDKNNQEIDENPQIFVEIDKQKYKVEKEILYKNELKILKTCLDTGCPKRLNDKEEIQRLSTNVILGINLRNPVIKNECDERKLNLSGNYIFEIKNCTLVINNKNYSNLYKEYEDDNVFEMFNQRWKELNVTFEHTKIKHINNLEEIQKFNFHKKLTLSLHGIMFLIIIIIINFVMWIYFHNRKTYKLKPASRKIFENLHQESKVNSNEGGVTLQIPHIKIKENIPSFSLGIHQ